MTFDLTGFEAASRSAPDAIADALREAIFEGRLVSGTPLKQLELAERFSVSAVPVREAFQKLVAEGLAITHRNRGVIVAPLTESNLLDIAELRGLLEAHALRRSAPHLTADDLSEAEQTLRLARAAKKMGEQASLHWRFHRILYGKADRVRLLAQIDSLFVNMNRYVMAMWHDTWLSADWEDSHLAIVEALRAEDVDAAVNLVVAQNEDAVARVIDFLRDRQDTEA